MKSLKKIISLIAVISLLSTSIFALSVGTASATTTPDIRLHSTEVTYQGSRGNTVRTVYIKVKDTERYGRTYVHYEYAPGYAWQDVEAEKTNFQSKEGYSIYKATFSSYSNKFALKYDFVASTLWDNNYYRDFTDKTLGYNENVKAERTYNYGNYNGCFDVSAIVRNISYAKEVKCVWSEDNFKTIRTVNLNYKEMINDTTSYGSQIERWTGKVTGIKNTSNFKFYITYKTLADGKTYTDNNFNQNYNYNYIISRG